jgi:hypothetical protein
MWLSAFAGLIAWIHEGVQKGAEEKKIPYNQANCTTFALGEEAKCKLAYSTMGVGVIILYVFLQRRAGNCWLISV